MKYTAMELAAAQNPLARMAEHLRFANWGYPHTRLYAAIYVGLYL